MSGAASLSLRGLRIPPVVASVLLLLAMVAFGSIMYTGFFSASTLKLIGCESVPACASAVLLSSRMFM